MKTKRITIVSLGLAALLVAGTVTVFATSAQGGTSGTPTKAAGGCYLHVRRDSAGVISGVDVLTVPPLWVVECTYWTMKLTDSSPCLSSP